MLQGRDRLSRCERANEKVRGRRGCYCVCPDDMPESEVKEFMECEKTNAGDG